MKITIEHEHNPTAEETAEYVANKDSSWQADFLYQLMSIDISNYSAQVQAHFVATEFIIAHGDRTQGLIAALDFFKELLVERMKEEGKVLV